MIGNTASLDHGRPDSGQVAAAVSLSGKLASLMGALLESAGNGMTYPYTVNR
jgi:hypothetical protein